MGNAGTGRYPSRRTFLKGLGMGALAGWLLGAGGGAVTATEMASAAPAGEEPVNDATKGAQPKAALPITLTPGRSGPMQVKVGETARIFFVNGGPNLISSFHPIGNVWTKAWPAGALANEPQRYVQTQLVAPGSRGVFEMEFLVPEDVKLVDHALSRVVHKGMLGIIRVEGEPRADIFSAV
ncbi:MAG TPA: hypothetical protein VFL93_03840 [Longimicrobiaceae bacterium]|nr:hypothetical protein [Longimicrobiaceae bacterium]